MADLVTNPENQERLADAICERPELLFKAAEHAIGKPRQTLEVASSQQWVWTPPARADGPISVREGTIVFPPGEHIHEGDEEERHCHICRENWAARVDETNECPRGALHPEERRLRW